MKKKNFLNKEKTNYLNDYINYLIILKAKKNIKEFLEDKKDYISDTFQFAENIKKYNKKILFFQIKIIGPLFLICFLIILFQIMDYITTLKEEVFYSIKIFFNQNTTDIGKEFYSRLKFKENNTIPNFSLFFISSFLSGLLLQYLNFPILAILVLAIIGLIFYFGINTFNFVENKNYSFKQILTLFFYFIGIDFLLGLIALLPIQLLVNGYFIYEKSIQENNNFNRNIIDNDLNNINNKKKEITIINPVKEKINNIINIGEENKSLINYEISKEDSFHIIDINQEKIIEPKNKDELFVSYNGFTFSYFISFIFSLFIRDGINTEI